MNDSQVRFTIKDVLSLGTIVAVIAIQWGFNSVRIATAEESGLGNDSVDLITAATAAHWFNQELFYKETQRVAKPNAILAVWTYSSATISKQIDEVMEWFAYDFLYSYWPDGRWYVRNQYKTLPFPFTEISSPPFFCRKQWNKQQWLNYVMSWSSYDAYRQKHHADALEFLLPKLNLLWNDSEIKEVK